MTCEPQQWPGTSVCHTFSIGEHCTYVNKAERPRKRFTVMMQNHTTRRLHPCEKRRRVMAKDVLLQAAAVIEQTPVTLDKNR